MFSSLKKMFAIIAVIDFVKQIVLAKIIFLFLDAVLAGVGHSIYQALGSTSSVHFKTNFCIAVHFKKRLKKRLLILKIRFIDDTVFLVIFLVLFNIL